MSVSLDSRSKGDTHEEEDREALATRPGGAPSAPQEFRRGGEVYDDDEQDDDDQEQEPADEEELEPGGYTLAGGPDEMPEGEAPEELPEGEVPEELPEGEAPEELPESPGGGGAGGGGGGAAPQRAPTGYQQPEEEAAPGDEAQATGYGQQAQAQPRPATPLKEVLDYTRRQLGVTAPQQAPAAAESPDQQLTAASAATVQAAGPSGQTGSTVDEPAETAIPQPPPQQATAPGTEHVPATPSVRTEQQPATPSGPGNKQAIQDYVSGKGAFTPDQMTEILDRTNQTDPNLGQEGSIRKAFQGLVDKGDVDGASKFVQALRPSYDSMRALLIAATAKGDFTTAMQIAGRMNSLVPSDEQVRFDETANGQILATIQPADGGPSTSFTLTPQQFAQYANSPLSLFDHTAEQGIGTNLSMLTGGPGQQGSSASAAGTQFAGGAAPGATMTDAGPATGAQPPAARPPVTGFNPYGAGGDDAGGLKERGYLRDTPAPNPNRPTVEPMGRTAPRQESNAMKAWRAFPYDNQRTQRGRYEERLTMQDRRDAARGKPEDRMAIEQLKSKDRVERTKAMLINNYLTNGTKIQSEVLHRSMSDYLARQKSWNDANQGVPYVSRDPEQRARDNAMFQWLNNNLQNSQIDFTQPSGRRAPGAPQQAPAQAQPRPAQATPAAAPAGAPPPPPAGVDLKTYKGTAPPYQLAPADKQGWQWSHMEDGTGWLLVPRQKPAAAAPAPTPAPTPAAPRPAPAATPEPEPEPAAPWRSRPPSYD
jgi:hypothetical protein